MKILLTCHQFFPRAYHGTERYTLDLAHSLESIGHQVTVLTTCRETEDSQGTAWHEYVFEEIRVIAVDLIHAGIEDFTTSYTRPDLGGVYGEILCRERPDLVHCCHLLYLGTDFLSVAAIAQVPVFMTLTDFFGICWTNRLQTCQGKTCPGPDQDDLNCVQDVLQTVRRPFRLRQANSLFRRLARYSWFIRQIRRMAHREALLPPSLRVTVAGIEKRRPCITKNYRHITRFIAATDYLRDSYLRSGYEPERIEVIRFGIAQPTADDQLLLDSRYESLGSSSRPFVIGFIGQVSEHKGIHVLLGAFATENMPNCELHVYGDVNQSADTARKVREHAGNDSRIKLCGTFKGSEIYRVLSTIDVLVMPSTWAENSPLVLLNALASRTFVVVSDVNGMAEMVEDGINGRLVRPSDPVELGSILAEVLRKRDTLRVWSETVTKPYQTSPIDYARQIDSRYSEAIRANNRPQNYNRDMYPRMHTSPVTVTCRSLQEPPSTVESADSSAWESLNRHHVAITYENGYVQLDLESEQANLILTKNAQQHGAISLVVKWPKNGTTAFYYSTRESPQFCEAKKICVNVTEKHWHAVRITFTGQSTDLVTRVRWDPLFDGAANRILVTKFPLQRSGHA